MLILRLATSLAALAIAGAAQWAWMMTRLDRFAFIAAFFAAMAMAILVGVVREVVKEK